MPKKQSVSKRKLVKAEDLDEETIKKTLRGKKDRKVNKKAKHLAALLPTIEKNENGVITNDALDQLYNVLVGDTGKEYDSDDSLISELDFMDAKEIAKKDKKSKELQKWSNERMDDDIKRVETILSVGHETVEERDARRKRFREEKMGLKTKGEKAAAERERQKHLEEKAEHLAKKIQVFDGEIQDANSTFPTCTALSELFEVMAGVTPEENSERGTGKRQYRHNKILPEIPMEYFAKEIKFYAIKCNFSTAGATVPQFMVSLVEKLLGNQDILSILNDEKLYGFNFTTSDCIRAFQMYFSFNKPAHDNGSSIEPLAIHLHQLVKAAYHVAHTIDRDFVDNQNLRNFLGV